MSITYETPGVYIEEITGPGVIQGVSTSVAGFVGPTARGTSTEAVQVTSFEQFMERFTAPGAPHLYDSAEEPVYLSFALQGFFQNGGRRAHIARVSNGNAAWAELLNSAGGVEAIVRARVEGAMGNDIRVGTRPSARTWKLAAPTASVVTQSAPKPPPGFPPNDARVLELNSNTPGFAIGDSIRIAGPPAAPVVDNPGDQRTPVGGVVDLLLSVSSASGGPLTFTENGLPSPLQIDAAGRITGQPSAAGPPATVTITSTDGAQSTDVTFTWEVFQPAPTIAPPGQQTNNTGDQVSLQIQAQSQSPTPGALAYTLAGQNELSIDANGLITGQPTTAGVSDVSVTVTEGAAQTTTRFAWVIGPSTAPVVDNPGDQRTPVGGVVDLLLSVSSASGGPLTFTENGLPSPLQIDAAGRITGQPSAAGPPATVTITSTDGAQSTDVTFTWEVFQPGPTIAPPGQQTNNTGDQVSLQIQAQSQSPTPGALAYTLAGQNELSIDANGLITGQPTTAGVSDVSVTVTEGAAQTTTRFAWVIPAPVLAVVERTDQQWLLFAKHLGAVLDPNWPGVISSGAMVGLVDYGPAETLIRLEPVAPEMLPAVGTWIEAGSGPDAVSFRVRRASANGVVTADRREPPDKTVSLRLHRDLTSLGFDLLMTSATSVTTTIKDLSLDPISPRFLLAEGVVPPDVVIVEEPHFPLFSPARRMGTASVPLKKGADFKLDDLGSDDYRRAINLLERIDEVSMVCVPDAARYDEGRRVTRRTIQGAQLGHCLRMADRIAVFDPPQAPPSDENIEDQIGNVINDLRSTRGFGVVYYPWLRVLDPRSTAQRPLTMLVPPSGHIAGVMARIDMTRGVFKAPANATVDEVLGVEQKLTDSEQAPLNVAGVNVLRILPGSNRVTVWGARTTVDPFVTDWLYLNVRRLLLFLEESIQDGIRWAVFEPNNLGLWKSLRRVITAFLREQWQAGALFGAREEEAFRVRIDEALNPPSTRKKGYLYIEIKVAPVRPAEFIVVRIGLFDGGADVEEV